MKNKWRGRHTVVPQYSSIGSGLHDEYKKQEYQTDFSHKE